MAVANDEPMNYAPPEDRMIFIVGRGRSGTTLLRRVLDAHPSISVVPEGLFVMNLHRSYRRGAWTEKRIRRFSRHLFLERRMRRWSVNREDLEARWLAMTGDATFARLSAEVYEMHADVAAKEPGRLLGDKNPHYALFVSELREIFPRARFIHMVRDYRDNVSSYMGVPFDSKSPAVLAHRWIHYNAAVLEAAKQAPDDFHLLRFEDLVCSPVPTIQKLCLFLGVIADPAMIVNHDSVGVPEVAWHRHVERPIDAQLAGQWRRTLTPKQVLTLDRICQPFAARFGYAPAEPGKTTKPRPSIHAAIGLTITTLERSVFKLPVSLQALLINIYRRLTGNVIR